MKSIETEKEKETPSLSTLSLSLTRNLQFYIYFETCYIRVKCIYSLLFADLIKDKISIRSNKDKNTTKILVYQVDLIISVIIKKRYND